MITKLKLLEDVRFKKIATAKTSVTKLTGIILSTKAYYTIGYITALHQIGDQRFQRKKVKAGFEKGN